MAKRHGGRHVAPLIEAVLLLAIREVLHVLLGGRAIVPSDLTLVGRQRDRGEDADDHRDDHDL